MIYDESAMQSYDYWSQFRMVFSGPNHVQDVLLAVEVTVVHLIQLIKEGRMPQFTLLATKFEKRQHFRYSALSEEMEHDVSLRKQINSK